MNTNFQSLQAISEHNHSNQSHIETGLSTLDSVINGFYQGELIVLASRLGIGKSMASQIAIKQNLPVVVFSLGIKKEQFFSHIHENLCKFYYINDEIFKKTHIDQN